MNFISLRHFLNNCLYKSAPIVAKYRNINFVICYKRFLRRKDSQSCALSYVVVIRSVSTSYTKMKIVMVISVLAAVASISQCTALPNYWKDNTYRDQVRHQQTGGQCSVIQPVLVCKSARVTVSGRHSYIHVCPAESTSMY